MRIVVMFVFLLALSGVGLGQERFVRPVDSAAEDPSFLAFRTKLIAAAERKDAAFILRILDPRINLSFGGHEGIADFKSMWKITSRNTKFWEEFLPVIKNGGTWWKGTSVDKIFYAPYTFDSFPEDIDAFTHEAIFGSNVNLREGPSTRSRVMAQLSYNVVTVETDPDTEAGKIRETRGWSKVRTLGGLSGWVRNDLVRSPIDYRAGFEKKRGVWKMVAFIAGD
ncbi:MAG: SH3 domain-containing protein [Pyrinomonadaceae bacterium]